MPTRAMPTTSIDTRRPPLPEAATPPANQRIHPLRIVANGLRVVGLLLAGLTLTAALAWLHFAGDVNRPTMHPLEQAMGGMFAYVALFAVAATGFASVALVLLGAGLWRLAPSLKCASP